MSDPWLDTLLLEAWLWRALVTAVLVAVPCAVLGVFLVLRRRSTVADAQAHLALPGIVLAYLATGSTAPFVMLGGALVVGLGGGLGIEALIARARIRPDAAVGLVYAPLFALGVVLLSAFVRDAHIDVQCVLFGDVLGVADTTLLTLAIVTPAVLVVVVVVWRWLVWTAFDELHARAHGVPIALVHRGVMALVAVVAVASFEAAGAVLVVALFVVPGATAHLVSRSPIAMVGLAAGHAVLSSVLGLGLSIALDCSTAGAMVAVAGALYGLVRWVVARRGQGIA